MRIFVNNVDGFLAGAICADLMKLSHSIMGTMKGSSPDLIPPMVKKIIPRIEVRKLLKTVASCDVVVYDLHDADLEELELVLRTLHTSELTQDMVFILVSSVGIWARTQREFEFVPDTRPPAEHDRSSEPDAAAQGQAPGETEEEAPPVPVVEPVLELPRRPAMLRGEDYVRRVPTPKFQEWKAIETLALALKRKSHMRPYVVCAGIPYGNGEEAFLGLFKAAWQNLNTLRIIGAGSNYIPTVHARDCARLVRVVAEEKPSVDYHLAVDRGELTQRALVQSVAQEFGVGYEIESVNVAEAILAELADILTLDLRLEPSPLMEPTSPAPPAEPAAGAAGALAAGADRRSELGSKAEGSRSASAEPTEHPAPARFRWWCEEGLAANAGKVAEEFCRWRRLDPVRFCIVGPPGTPVAEFAKLLAERYALPPVAFDHVVEETRSADTALGQQLRDRLEEIAVALNNPKSQGPFLIPASLTAQLVEVALGTKPARYRGWTLAGYPQTSEECALTFLEDAPPKEPEEGEEEEAPPEAPPPPSKGGKAVDVPPPEPEKVPRTSMAPDVVVVLSQPEEAFQELLQSADGPAAQKEIQLKMDRWKKDNPEEGPKLADFFSAKFGSKVLEFEIREGMDMGVLIDSVTEALESGRRVANFLPSTKPAGACQAQEATLERTKTGEELARAEAEVRKKKKEQEERLEHIRREEHARLERHSEPLRQYMSSLVVPTLASGLVEVCRKQPDDPVGYLAEYLAVYSELARKHGKLPGKMAAA